MQQGTRSVPDSAIERVVELVPGVNMTHRPMEGSWTYISLTCAVPWRGPRGSRPKTSSRSMVTVGAEYINETWTNSMLYSLCVDWYARILFTRWGGLRAAWRAARELKAVRDACRARFLVDERERGASHA